jgi:predicted nucleotidyltransferase
MIKIPQCVEDILTWWLGRIEPALNGTLKSVTLFGSVALGDYQPAWSDIDVCVVLKRPIDAQTGIKIGRIHDGMRDTFIGSVTWQSPQVIEGFYISADMATDPGLERACYAAGGTTRKWFVGNPVSPFDRYLLSHHGFPYWGKPVSFAPPSLSALKIQLKQDVESLGRFEEYPALWLAGILHWIPRSLIFWRDGILLSKTAALEHEIDADSPFAAIFTKALELRKHGHVAAEEAYQELLEMFRPIVADIQHELTR